VIACSSLKPVIASLFTLHPPQVRHKLIIQPPPLSSTAFGDYKKSKKARAAEATQEIPREFEDIYDPGVDESDPLAAAFGDGFRTSKPVEVGTRGKKLLGEIYDAGH